MNFRDPKKLTPAITLAVFGGVWLIMQWKHIPQPPALAQAIVAAAGSLAAGAAAGGALPAPKEEPRGAK